MSLKSALLHSELQASKGHIVSADLKTKTNKPIKMGRSFQSCVSFIQYLGSPFALGPVSASWESLTKQAIHPMTDK